MNRILGILGLRHSFANKVVQQIIVGSDDKDRKTAGGVSSTFAGESKGAAGEGGGGSGGGGSGGGGGGGGGGSGGGGVGGRGHDEAGPFRRGHQRKGKPSRRQSHAGERDMKSLVYTTLSFIHIHIHIHIHISVCGSTHMYTDI